MKNQFKHIGELVKTSREKTPWSQSDLGAVIGVTGQYVSNIERGLAGVPVKQAYALSKRLNITLDEMKTAMLKDYEARLDLSFAKHGVLI